MPTLFKMTDAKEADQDTSVVITQVTAADPKPRNAKKIVIIAVSAVLAAAIILTAILVGMYLFTQGQQEILQYTMNVDKNTKEDVTVDPNENVNQYHVQDGNYEMWVVDDFNRDIKVTKIQSKTDTNCYVVPLNRTKTLSPSEIKNAPSADVKPNSTERLYYDVSSTPISDTSFLGKTAREACKGISVYWLYPKCNDESKAVQRKKRTTCEFQYCYSCVAGNCCVYVCY